MKYRRRAAEKHAAMFESDDAIFASKLDAYVAKVCKECMSPSRPVAATTEYLTNAILKEFFSGDDDVVMPDRMPFAIKTIPSLARVATKQARLTSYIVTAIATRPIVTIWDLQEEICFQEGVEAFAELGFGLGLHYLPIVQQFFQVQQTTPIYPVTTRHVLEFLTYKEEALSLLEGQGDTRDLLNMFSRYYENNQRTLQANTTHAAPSNLPPKVRNPRQLGIHIQSLAWLLTTLRQEVAQVHDARKRVVQMANTQIQQNTDLYKACIENLDAALMQQRQQDDHSQKAKSLTFDIHMSESDAMATTCDRRMFASDLINGGVKLQCTLGSIEASSSGTQPAGTAMVPPTPSSSSAIPAGISQPVVPRRRRGGTIISETPSILETIPEEAPPVIVSEPQPLVPSATMACSPGATLIAPAAAAPPPAPPSLVSQLNAFLDASASPSAQDVLAVTSAMTQLAAGSTLEWSLLHAVVLKLFDSCDTHAEVLEQLKETAWIPIPHPFRSSGDSMEMVAVARPCDVCWSCPQEDVTVLPAQRFPMARQSSEASALFRTALSHFFTESFREPFTRLLGVSEGATTSSFLFSCGVNRTLYSTSELSGAFVMQFLALLQTCVVHDYEQRLRFFGQKLLAEGKQEESASVAAIDDLLSTVVRLHGESLPMAYVFPYRYAWRRGVDDLFFGGPHFFGLSDVYLKPVRAATTTTSISKKEGSLPPLRLLAFLHEPHIAVQAVLRLCGVESLEACVTRRVVFDNIQHTPQTVWVHQQLALVLPYVQCYLRNAFFEEYKMSYTMIQNRLKGFRVVLGDQVEQTERLQVNGVLYAMRQTVRFSYVAQHNTFYGDVGDRAPSILAEATADLFLPLPTTHRVREGLVGILTGMFSVLSSCVSTAGDAPSEEDTNSMAAALDKEARKRGIKRFDHSQSGRHANEEAGKLVFYDKPLSICAAPSSRVQLFFPPGSDGFSQPSWAAPLRQHHSSKGSAAGKHTNDEKVIQQTAAHLPQWRSALFREGYDVLSSLLANEGILEDHTVTLTPQEHAAEAPLDAKEETPAEAADGDTEGNIGFGRALLRLRAAAMRANKRQRTLSSSGDGQKGSHHRWGGAPTFVSSDGISTADDTTGYAAAAEKFVFDVLQQQHANSGIRVVWVNESGERGTPYDIMLVRPARSPQYPHMNNTDNLNMEEILEYIEVKCTSTSDRLDFEMSLRELLFAARYGRSYKVYRVFGASTSALRKMRFQIYEDIVQLWHTGRFTLTGNVKAMPTFGN